MRSAPTTARHSAAPESDPAAAAERNAEPAGDDIRTARPAATPPWSPKICTANDLRRNQLAALAAAIERVAPLDVPADAALSAFFRSASRHGCARPRVRRRRRVRLAAAQALARDACANRRIRACSRWPCTVREVLGIRCATSSRRSTRATRVARRVQVDGCASRLPPAVAADVPDWLWDAPRRGLRRRCTRRADACVAVARAVRPARQSTEDHARGGARGACAPRDSTSHRRRMRRSASASTGDRRWRAIRGSSTGVSRCRTKAASSSRMLVAPRRSDMVVDFCAGAGGKTLLLGATDALAGTAVRVRRRWRNGSTG